MQTLQCPKAMANNEKRTLKLYAINYVIINNEL